MKSKTIFRSMLAAGILMTAAWACKTDDDNVPAAPVANVALKETSLGKVLTDEKGMTLYFFSKDVAGASVCTGTCLDNWPAFTVESLRLQTGLDTADFKSITRTDGVKQITFRGWPLYRYKQDVAAGDVKGENSNKIWFVAKPSYSMMLASTQLVGNDAKNYVADATGVLKEGDGQTVYFTDAKGLTVYGFANDKKNVNKYTKEDMSNNGSWPIFYTEIKDLPSTMDKTLFSTIKIWGKDQLTYKGWPLYYFGSDKSTRGVTKGVSVPKVGVWPIIQIATPAAPES